MEKKTDITRLPAFTIFELTVVLAIFSTLVVLIMFGYRRFNEQLKMSSEISAQLNTWRMERACLWKDFFTADSARIKTDEVLLYRNSDKVVYRTEDGQLFRRINQAEETLFSLPEAGIAKVVENGKTHAEFTFTLNDAVPVKLAFFPPGSRKQEIDTYFNDLANE